MLFLPRARVEGALGEDRLPGCRFRLWLRTIQWKPCSRVFLEVGCLHPVIGLAQSWFWEEVEEEAEGAGDVSWEGAWWTPAAWRPRTSSLSCLSLLGSENLCRLWPSCDVANYCLNTDWEGGCVKPCSDCDWLVGCREPHTQVSSAP